MKTKSNGITPTKASLLQALRQFNSPDNVAKTKRLHDLHKKAEKDVDDYIASDKEYQRLKRICDETWTTYMKSYDREKFSHKRNYLIALINAHGVTPKTLKAVQEFIEQFNPE